MHREGEMFVVSSERSRFDVGQMEALLRQSFWAANRKRSDIEAAAQGSVCYGVYDQAGCMKGCARVITDHATTFYLCDVIVDESVRGIGLGTLLMERIMEDVGHLHGILHTEDAAVFYERYEFVRKTKGKDILMEKPRREMIEYE